MRHPPERRWPLVAGHLAFVALVILAAMPMYLFVEMRWRPVVVRITTALILGVFLKRVHKGIVGVVLRDMVSTFDAALASPPPPPRPDSRLVELVAAVKAAVRSRRAFEHWVWPRLAGLARTPVAAPRSRRFGLGPSLDDLCVIVKAIEDRL